MTSLRSSRAGTGIVSSVAAGLVLMISSILLIPLYIWAVGASQYGVWLTIITFVTVLYYADLGAGSAIVHFSSMGRGGGSQVSSSSMLSTVIALTFCIWLTASAILAILVNFAMRATFESVGLSVNQGYLLIAAAIIALFALVLKPFESTLVGAGYLNYERRNQILGAAFRIVGSVLVCIVFRDIVVIAFVEATALLIPPICSAIVILRNQIAHFQLSQINSDTRKMLLGYSVRSFAVSVSGAFILQVGTILVAIFATPAVVTYYAAAFKIFSSVRQLVSWTTDPFRPMLSRLWRHEEVAARRTFLTLSYLSTQVATMGCIVLMLSSGSVIRLWLGDNEYAGETTLTLNILLCGLLLNLIHIPMIAACDAAGKPGLFIKVQVAWLTIYIVLGCILAPMLGMVGVAIAMMAPLIVLEPLYFQIAKTALGFSLQGWIESVLNPVLRIVLVPALVSAVFVVYSGNTAGYVAVTIFLSGSVLFSSIFRSKLPINEVKQSLRVAL